MKHALLLIVSWWLVMLFAIETKGQAYTYIHFPEPNLTWYGTETFHAMGSSWTTPWTIETYGDTILNSKSYRNIGQSYFREDSLKRVYVIDGYDTTLTEKLVYDFSLSVGDTMHSGTWSFIVVSVDTLDYCGTPRRHLLMSDGINLQDSWVEGLGSDRWSPFGRMYLNCECFLCAIAQNSQIILPGCFSCGANPNAIETPVSLRVKLTPNPATTNLYLQSEITPSAQTNFLLFDITSRMVLQQELSDKTTRIDVSTLSRGMYLYQVVSGREKMGAGKVVFE